MDQILTYLESPIKLILFCSRFQQELPIKNLKLNFADAAVDRAVYTIQRWELK